MRIDLPREISDFSTLVKLFGGELRGAIPPYRVRGIATSSEEVTRGDLFLALVGKHHNGWDFAADAEKRGAVGIIAPATVSLTAKMPHLAVKDPQKALFHAVQAKRKMFTGTVIAIGGSTGKTTLKEGLFSVIEEVGTVAKSRGNFNSSVGMPLSFLSMPRCDFYLLELGINHPGEMREMSEALSPDIAILTNVGSAHIGNFGSYNALKKEKCEIAAGLAENGIFLLSENVEICTVHERKSKIYRFGCGMNCSFRAENIHMDQNGTRLTLTDGTRRYRELCSPVCGEIGKAFLTAVGSVGLLLSVPEENMMRGLARATALLPRMRRIAARERLLIDDTYNASPEGVLNSLEMLMLTASERPAAAVLGDVLELGDFTEELHISVGECAGRLGMDVLLLYGEAAERIGEGAKNVGMSCERILCFSVGEEEELISAILTRVPKNAVILFKGSRGMHLEKILKEVERRS